MLLALLAAASALPQHAHDLQRFLTRADFESGSLGGSPSAQEPGDRGETGSGAEPSSDGIWLRSGESWSSAAVDRRAAPFHEALLSWNIAGAPEAGFRVELQVGRDRAHGPSPVWSPWLRIEDCPPARSEPERGLRAFDGGAVHVDVFKAEVPCDWIRFRVAATGESEPIFIDALSLCLTRRGEFAPGGGGEEGRRFDPIARIPLAFRSQRAFGPDLADSVCSPVSVAMVLSYRGVEASTQAVIEAVYDPLHEIWGNWPRNVQGAYELGVPGYLTRLSSWGEVADYLNRGQPLIASIAAAAGQLTGAPYPETTGHLLCIVGLDGAGGVLVSDPAAEVAGAGELIYSRSELGRAWLERGGTTYVLLAPGSGEGELTGSGIGAR